MSIWTLSGSGKVEAHGPLPAGSQAGAQLTAGVDSKGSWAELSAGFTYPTAGLIIHSEQVSAGGTRYLLDIGLGPATEAVVIPDLMMHGSEKPALFLRAAFPAGTSVVGRLQATGAFTARVGLWAIPASRGLTGIRRWSAYGINSSGTTAGTAVDAGAAANTLSGWTQLSASLPRPISELYIMNSPAALTGNTSSYGLVDIGVGPAASETVVIPTVHFRIVSGGNTNTLLGPYPVDIPVGARLAIRHQANSTVVASSRNMQWAVLAGG